MARLPLRKWIQGFVDSVLDGGASAFLAAVGTAAAHQVGADIELLHYKQVGAVVCSGALVSAVRFIKENHSPAFSAADVVGGTEIVRKQSNNSQDKNNDSSNHV
jgi:hypothetical protein